MTAAYNSGSTMGRTLESLEPGTPVFAGETRIGEVRGSYTEANSRSVELVVVYHDARGENVAVPSSEIESVTDRGVQLMRQQADQYQDLAPFDPARFPTMKPLK
ncbi:MAG TPA: hypothetical protein VHT05_11890 [Candidatus Elarobacter sp.]|nr:hypothetical protein [Candidatus Elarobacter sp.]